MAAVDPIGTLTLRVGRIGAPRKRLAGIGLPLVGLTGIGLTGIGLGRILLPPIGLPLIRVVRIGIAGLDWSRLRTHGVGLEGGRHARRYEIPATLATRCVLSLAAADALFERLLTQFVAETIALDTLAPAVLRPRADRRDRARADQPNAQQRTYDGHTCGCARWRGCIGMADRVHALHSRQGGQRPPSVCGKACNKG